MKPANFEFARAASLGEAAAMLREANGGAKAVAGGQSLGPMLNLRLVQPSVLDRHHGHSRIDASRGRRDGITVGACVTTAGHRGWTSAHGGSADSRTVAAGVAYRAVRNRGTIGGSICHADPGGRLVAGAARTWRRMHRSRWPPRRDAFRSSNS